MKIKELIKILQKCNQESPVTVSVSTNCNIEDFRIFGDVIDVNEITKCPMPVTLIVDGEANYPITINGNGV